MASATQQQILQQIGRSGWKVVGERDEMVTREVLSKNEFGDSVMVKQEVPSGNKVWVLSGPNGEPDEITVKQTQQASAAAGSPGSTDPSQPAQTAQYELVNGPSNAPPKATSSTNEPKNSRKTQLIDMPDGSKATIEVVADGLGNWSPDTSKQPVPYIAAEGKTPPAPVASTTLKQIPQLVDGKWTWGDNPNYVAPKGDTPNAATVSTSAEFIPDPENPTKFIKNPNYKKPGDLLTPGQTAVDTATASTAQGTAEAALAKAVADANKAKADLEDALRRNRQSPTDAQAQQAIATAQTAANLANQQLENAIKQSANLNPIQVQQAQATLDSTKASIASTQANTQKSVLGDLAGRREQLMEVKSLVQSGEISPAEGDAMMAALNRGMTVYQAMQQAQSDRSTARTQDVSNKNQLASTFGSTFTSGLSTLADMNKYAAVGSTAGADAFLALLNIAQDRLKNYEVAPAQQTDYLGGAPSSGGPPGVGAMAALAAGGGQSVAPPAAPPPAQPVAQQGAGGATFTFNIGSGAASNPQPPTPQLLPAGMAGTGQDPRNMFPRTANGPTAADDPYGRLNAMVGTANTRTPASEDDIMQAYGVPRRTV